MAEWAQVLCSGLRSAHRGRRPPNCPRPLRLTGAALWQEEAEAEQAPEEVRSDGVNPDRVERPARQTARAA